MTTQPPQGQNPFDQGQNAPGQQPPAPQGYPQQPGQPGVPQQPSPYVGQGGTAPAPPQQPRKNIKMYLRIGGVVVVLLVIAGIWYASRDDAATAKVGDCMSIGNPDKPSDPDLEVVSCSDSKARYKVVEKKDNSGGCDRTKYSEYTESRDGSSFTLCLTDYKP